MHSPSRSVAQPSFPAAKMSKLSWFCGIKRGKEQVAEPGDKEGNHHKQGVQF